MHYYIMIFIVIRYISLFDNYLIFMNKDKAKIILSFFMWKYQSLSYHQVIKIYHCDWLESDLLQKIVRK
jgi:hypothetical protein